MAKVAAVKLRGARPRQEDRRTIEAIIWRPSESVVDGMIWGMLLSIPQSASIKTSTAASERYKSKSPKNGTDPAK